MSKRKKVENPIVLAEAIVEAGYGTDSFNPETCECFHSCYASFVHIISGDWSEYETDPCAMDGALNLDFQLGFNFATYLIGKYSDGTKRSERVKWDYEKNCIKE